MVVQMVKTYPVTESWFTRTAPSHLQRAIVSLYFVITSLVPLQPATYLAIHGILNWPLEISERMKSPCIPINTVYKKLK